MGVLDITLGATLNILCVRLGTQYRFPQFLKLGVDTGAVV